MVGWSNWRNRTAQISFDICQAHVKQHDLSWIQRVLTTAEWLKSKQGDNQESVCFDAQYWFQPAKVGNCLQCFFRDGFSVHVGFSGSIFFVAPIWVALFWHWNRACSERLALSSPSATTSTGSVLGMARDRRGRPSEGSSVLDSEIHRDMFWQ